jgi:hypothetical protein
VTIALAVLALPAPAAAGDPAKVSLAWLPPGTTVAQLATAGLSPGLMSAGLGTVPPAQTYLDISQGNRVFDSLYDSDLPPAAVPLNRPIEAAAALRRAESAPADIVPGLLAHSLAREAEHLAVRDVSLSQLPGLVSALGGGDLLIAIERPPPPRNEALAIGVAGRGFDGDLTSDSTRLDGYVLSTDVAPTILDRLGVAVPAQMSGQPIRAEGSVDPAAVAGLGERLSVISERRGPVIGLSLLCWIVLAALIAIASRGRAARQLVRVLGLAVVLLPLLLLVTAGLDATRAGEQAVVGLGAPVLAGLTLLAWGGLRAIAVASGITVLAHAIDVIAGSPLTALSLLGPNPGLGVRFYGIGNELEALLAVLTIAGTGAALSGFGRPSPAGSATAFLTIGFGAAFVFAAGRFGADVGAAIVFPAGAAVAAAVVARRRRSALLVATAPLAVLGLLILVDLVSGANAHLTRSVLDAGGFGDLADVAQRRLELSAHSFARPIVLVFLPLIASLAVLAAIRRDRIERWLQDRLALRAGLIGAAAAIAVGTLANDSGALLLEIGAAYLLVFVGFAWAEAESEGSTAAQTKSYDDASQRLCQG